MSEKLPRMPRKPSIPLTAAELAKVMRRCGNDLEACSECPYLEVRPGCIRRMVRDGAAAIDALRREVRNNG